jgi:hypothetical protein
MLQNSPYGAGFEFRVTRQWTNIIDEMQSWRKTATLFDQSCHMMELRLKGPDLQRLLNRLAVNNFEKFGRDQAKQIVCVNGDGYLHAGSQPQMSPLYQTPTSHVSNQRLLPRPESDVYTHTGRAARQNGRRHRRV